MVLAISLRSGVIMRHDIALPLGQQAKDMSYKGDLHLPGGKYAVGFLG